MLLYSIKFIITKITHKNFIPKRIRNTGCFLHWKPWAAFFKGMLHGEWTCVCGAWSVNALFVCLCVECGWLEKNGGEGKRIAKRTEFGVQSTEGGKGDWRSDKVHTRFEVLDDRDAVLQQLIGIRVVDATTLVVFHYKYIVIVGNNYAWICVSDYQVSLLVWLTFSQFSRDIARFVVFSFGRGDERRERRHHRCGHWACLRRTENHSLK